MRPNMPEASLAVFPPFSDETFRLVDGIVEGEIDRYVELLSINGHAILDVETTGGRVRVTVYASPGPLSKHAGAAYEWRLISSRLVDMVGSLNPLLERVEYADGYIAYTFNIGVEEGERLASIIAGARRVAGLNPLAVGVYDPNSEVFLYPYRSHAALDMLSVILADLVVFEPDPDMVEVLYRSLQRRSDGLWVGPILLSRIASDSGVSKSTVHRLFRHLEALGAARKIDGRYYVDLRHEVIASIVLVASHAISPENTCILLPYLEGATHNAWRVFPGPYSACEKVSSEIREYEVEWEHLL